MPSPSTQWKETIADDEAERFARQAAEIRQAHARKNAVHGPGRFLHRKTLAGAEGTLEVADTLPDHARHGLFAHPGSFPVAVRLSHGSLDLQANTKPDIRGFAFQVKGVSGPSALGGQTDHQDFLLINHPAFASPTSDEFLEITNTMAHRGELGLLFHLVGRYGLKQGLDRLKLLMATLAKPFSGYNSETFYSAVPVAVGPYAAKVRLRPLHPAPLKGRDPGADFAQQLTSGPLSYELALQFFVDEAHTPIEAPPVVWDEGVSPYLPVATLRIEGVGSPVEGLRFDPWSGLADHRPLGEIMRARKGAYYESQKARGVL